MQCYCVQKRREPEKCGKHTAPCCQPIFFWNIISSSYMVLATGSLITYTTSSLCWILIWFYFFLLILNTSIFLFLSTVLLKSLQTGSNFCPFEHLVIRCSGGTVQFSCSVVSDFLQPHGFGGTTPANWIQICFTIALFWNLFC